MNSFVIDSNVNLIIIKMNSFIIVGNLNFIIVMAE